MATGDLFSRNHLAHTPSHQFPGATKMATAAMELDVPTVANTGRRCARDAHLEDASVSLYSGSSRRGPPFVGGTLSCPGRSGEKPGGHPCGYAQSTAPLCFLWTLYLVVQFDPCGCAVDAPCLIPIIGSTPRSPLLLPCVLRTALYSRRL